ncbi:hypothetical protein GN244_ATG02842 [Phytophthora infestans]|uniref:PcF and SCR74-like cys-rich secreted peptide n=1 Tax=Phytophthora infestans TaxID=4787 RepID=A0A833T2B8_PHYIN|nr:hypothetical protein GN244_ATG02842 [Phytophthora infestans]
MNVKAYFGVILAAAIALSTSAQRSCAGQPCGYMESSRNPALGACCSKPISANAVARAVTLVHRARLE